jgi:hypothetical protein
VGEKFAELPNRIPSKNTCQRGQLPPSALLDDIPPSMEGVLMLTKPRAAKGPLTRFCTQASFDWVVLNIPHSLPKMLRVANVAIEILVHPELSTSVQKPVRFMRCIEFVRVHHLR